MAAEWAASAAANTVGNLGTECLSPYINYFFCFGRIVAEFKNLRNELESKKQRLQDDVDEALRQTEVIYKDVEEWLTRAGKELGEAQSLEDEIERNKCFNWCPSWGWRYYLSMKVAKKSICIKNFIETCNFSRVGQRPPLQGIEFLPSKDFKASQSSTVAFNAIIKALTTDGVNTIGLYGMPGVGKTTLAKEVGKYVGEQELFDKVVMVTMSQTPIISKIQDRMAEILGLKFETYTEEGKAEELWRRLKGEKILIIIDDVWNDFKLETIGISLHSENQSCKILLTTRLQLVCIQMNCQEKIELKILFKEEAWALFKENAGLEDHSPTTTELIEVAKELAGECQGLPLAIITVAKSLKGQTINAWEAANLRLKESRHLDNQRVIGNIYSCLELSYDYLTGDNTKSCLLLCSLFPEDCNIPISSLALIGIGEGLFDNIELMEEQMREMRLALVELQQSGLLLEINDKRDTVRVHDVVRDFAHWLTFRGNIKFMVKDKLTKWAMNENFDSYTAFAIWNFNMNSFPDKLEFKKLKTLILRGKRGDLLTIPSTFFEGMKALRVLWLEDFRFSLEALQFLTNLRALFLNCEVMNNNLSSSTNMEKLEILVVEHVDIAELFKEFERVRHLKYLYSTNIKFPSNTLSRLTSLQGLHVIGRNNINIWELSSLPCLTASSLHVSSDHLQEDFVFPKLQSYHICVNGDPTITSGQTLRILEIHRGFLSSLTPFKELFCNLKNLILRDVSGVRYIVSNEEGRQLNDLNYLQLLRCQDLEYLIDQNLHHHLAITSLQSLKVVEVVRCEKLKSIFSPCVAHCLLRLQQLSIRECNELEQVFDFAENHEQIDEQQQPLVLTNLIDLELTDLLQLRSIWTGPTHLVNLSSLSNLEIRNCDKLECLFSPSLARTLADLKRIRIDSCEGLQHIISMEVDNGDALCWPKLNTVNIWRCISLKELFPMTLAQGLPALRNIEIFDCAQLKQVFAAVEDVQFVEQYQPPVFANSIKLKLIQLPELTSIWTEPTYLVNLSTLNNLEIQNCDKLECLFSHSLARTLVHLEHISIGRCQGLEHLVSTEAEAVDALCWPKLNSVNIWQCESLKDVFSITSARGLSALKNVEIFDCRELKQAFDFAEDAQFIEQDEENQRSALSNLTYLELKSLPELSCIWIRPTHLVNLSSLNTLRIGNCNKLAYIFPLSLSQTLVHLEHISIFSCESLEHLISMEPENGNAFCWPKLNTLKIEFCKNLKDVFSISLAQGLPSLKSIEIVECPQLIGLFSMAKENEQLPQHLQFLKSQSFINFTNFSLGDYFAILPSLVEFNIMQNLRYKAEKLGGAWFDKLYLEDDKLYKFKRLIYSTKDVNLQWMIHDKNLIPSLKPKELHKLTSLTIQGGKELECLVDALLVNDIEDLALLFSNLSNLELISLPELKCLWKGPTHKDSLQSLKVVNISQCNELKYVFSASLAQSLVQLQKLYIFDCNKLEHIISESQSDGEIGSHSGHDLRPVLPHLQDLNLCNLTNLSGFSSQNSHITLSFLNKLSIRRCPRLVNFSIKKEVNEQAQLKELWFSNSGYDRINNQQKHNSRNLEHSTIWEIFQNQDEHLLCKVETILLSFMDQLQGPIQVTSLHHLHDLRVEHCGGLKSLFSPLLARNLPQLTSLQIKYCTELEEIIEMVDKTSPSSSSASAQAHPPHMFIPNLELLRIEGCNNLKSLFPVSVISSLSKIKTIIIDGASELEKVFNYEAELDIDQHDQNQKRIELPNQKRIELPSLQSFELLRLSGLRSLAPTGYPLLFPCSCDIEIKECPKLTTCFSRDSKRDVVHAIAKAQLPQHLQNDTTRYCTSFNISSRTILPYIEEEACEDLQKL